MSVIFKTYLNFEVNDDQTDLWSSRPFENFDLLQNASYNKLYCVLFILPKWNLQLSYGNLTVKSETFWLRKRMCGYIQAIYQLSSVLSRSLHSVIYQMDKWYSHICSKFPQFISILWHLRNWVRTGHLPAPELWGEESENWAMPSRKTVVIMISRRFRLQ